MRIPNFSIVNNRSLRYAACGQLPKVMILTGPNGCGKSTLLDALRQAEGPSGPILYVGPHRISGRQEVRMRFLSGQKLLMRELQSNLRLPSYEGIDIHSQSRSAWDFDETSSYLKYALCQIELDRQAAITARFDNYRMIDRDTMPDIWLPLKEMTENLLPHLYFDKIDVSNRDRIQCLWNVHEKNIKVDIDDLSSGEKAIIHLFFPLIENRIQSLIEISKGEIGNTKLHQSTEQVCVLMDEPELHLHPNLQGKILDFLRNLAVSEDVQFVLATQSPTIVDLASSDELFLLRSSQMTGANENQLIQIASDDEKLELMREAFGSTSNITAMRNFLVVEGQKASSASRRATDEKIYGFLSDKFARLTILPGGNKDQCKTLAHSLSEMQSKVLSSGVQAYALVDRDLEEKDSNDVGVIYLPVSMIENFLVDPEVIWEAIVTVRHKTTLTDKEKVKNALDDILDGMTEHEISRRVKASIASYTFRLHDPVSTATEQASEHTNQVLNSTSDFAINKLKTEANLQIKKLIEKKSRREFFDGKKVLNKFYRNYLHSTGMSKEIFIYQCAQVASKRTSVKQFVTALMDKLVVNS